MNRRGPRWTIFAPVRIVIVVAHWVREGRGFALDVAALARAAHARPERSRQYGRLFLWTRLTAMDREGSLVKKMRPSLGAGSGPRGRPKHEQSLVREETSGSLSGMRQV
jgi:hypothetical protein